MGIIEPIREEDLNPGEIICPECLGHKRSPSTIIRDSIPNQYQWPSECKKCQGEGKLDWIEMAAGKKPKIDKIKINTMYGGFGIKVTSNFDFNIHLIP